MSIYWLFIFSCLFHSSSGRAIDLNTTALASADISSDNSFPSGNTTSSSNSCLDINNCRTLSDIVQSCIVTILACVWFAVHRNIPEPKVEKKYSSNILLKTLQLAWSIVLAQRQSAMIFIIALMVPEWVLAWALRQAFLAFRLAYDLDHCRNQAAEDQEMRWLQTANSREAGAESAEEHLTSAGNASALAHADTTNISLVHRSQTGPDTCRRCRKCVMNGCPCDLVIGAMHVGKGNQRTCMLRRAS